MTQYSVNKVLWHSYLESGRLAPMKKHHLLLSDDDRSTLERLLAKGSLKARKFKRATALLELERGKTLQEVATSLNLNYNTIAALRDKYRASV